MTRKKSASANKKYDNYNNTLMEESYCIFANPKETEMFLNYKEEDTK